MKSWIFGAITVGCMSFAGAALGCPTGFSEVPRPAPRPVQVQTVSFQASELVERASRLESAAVSHDQTARGFDQEADTFAGRARILRNQAQFVSFSDRSSLFDLADELVARSNLDRARAEDEREQAIALRGEARSLRNQASQLVRPNTGWRTTSPKFPTTTVLPRESAVTL